MKNLSAVFDRFSQSSDTLWITNEDTLLFRSAQPGIRPLYDYLCTAERPAEKVTVCDRVVGNAAALLMVIAHCTKVYAGVGSEEALKTLQKHSITVVLNETVPFIKNRTETGRCPFETMSLGKSPDDFFNQLKDVFS